MAQLQAWWLDFQDTFYRCFIEDDRWRYLTKGLGNTLLITFFALLLGVVIGVVVAIVRTSYDKNRENMRPGFGRFLLGFFNGICKIYLTVIRGTPVVVQLLLGVFVIFITMGELSVACIIFGINSGAYVAEIIRGGLMSLDPGQMEAGRSLGLGYLPTMTFIVVPQAFKAILPALGNEFITLLKDTSLISAIAGKEVVYFAKAIGAKTYDYMFPLLIIAVMYLILVLIFTWLQGILERRLRASDRR